MRASPPSHERSRIAMMMGRRSPSEVAVRGESRRENIQGKALWEMPTQKVWCFWREGRTRNVRIQIGIGTALVIVVLWATTSLPKPLPLPPSRTVQTHRLTLTASAVPGQSATCLELTDLSPFWRQRIHLVPGLFTDERIRHAKS